MAKCAACNATILLGGASWSSLKFCNEDCVGKLHIALTKSIVPSNDLEKEVEAVYSGNCPCCKGVGPNDVYTAKKVTGMILAVQWLNDMVVGCVSCGKSLKYKATLHCLALGWWSPKALLTNIFYVPYNLLGALFFTKPSMRPSATLTDVVCRMIAHNNQAKFMAIYRENAKSG